MTAQVDPAPQQPPSDQPPFQPPAAHRTASAWKGWSGKRKALTVIGAFVVLGGAATGGLTLANAGQQHHSKRSSPENVTLAQPTWLKTRNGIAATACAIPSSIRAWGQDPNTIADIYYRCAGNDGGQVYIRIFGSAGAEELFAERVGGYDTGSEQTVVGKLWAVSTDDQAALTASLDAGGQLL